MPITINLKAYRTIFLGPERTTKVGKNPIFILFHLLTNYML